MFEILCVVLALGLAAAVFALCREVRLRKALTRLDNSWDQLQRERRTASLLISMIPTVGAVLVVCLLLGFCWQALFRAHSEDVSQAELSSLLVEELVGESQRLRKPMRCWTRTLR